MKNGCASMSWEGLINQTFLTPRQRIDDLANDLLGLGAHFGVRRILDRMRYKHAFCVQHA